MSNIESKPDHGTQLIEEGIAVSRFQLYLDDIEEKFNVPTLPVFTVAQLTGDEVPASLRPDGLVMVSDEVGGQVPAFSDSVNWRRVTDRAIIS
jgi:hypothetical protein